MQLKLDMMAAHVHLLRMEPQREKTGLRGFRHGLTQLGFG